MIIVKKGTIKANRKNYIPGDIIEGLSEKEEALLVSRGKAEYLDENVAGEQEVKPNQEQMPMSSPDETENKTPEDSEKVENPSIDFDPDEYVKQSQDTPNISNTKRRR